MTLYHYMFMIAVIICNVVSEDVQEYKVKIATGDGPGAGTDASFLFTILGAYEELVEFTIDGNGEKLERGRIDVFKFVAKDVGSIDRLLVKRKANNGYFSNWYCKWIEITFRGSTYVFNIGRWIRDDYKHQYLATLGACRRNQHRIQKCVDK